MTGQMRHTHPRQNQKARIIRQPLQIAFPRRSLPADETVTVRAFPSCRPEQQAGQQPALTITDEIPEIFADGGTVSQIMMIREQTIEQSRGLRAGRNHVDGQGTQRP